MKQVLITGADGQLGSEIQALESKYPQYQFTFTDIHNLDLTDHKMVRSYIEERNFDVIINCAAYTAVGKAETELEINEALNHLAVKNLATIAKEQVIKLIQVSTDYVFDGTKGSAYIENDEPNPQSVYGQTKLAGEQAMIKINPKNSVIIRTSWVYSSYGNNFVRTMLRLVKEQDSLNVVADQFGSPTYAHDLAKAILDILSKIKNDNVEIYHYANQGICSRYEFAKAIFKIKEIQMKVKPISTDKYPTAAKRPPYCVLDTGKMKNNFSISIPIWEDSLRACLKKIELTNTKKINR